MGLDITGLGSIADMASGIINKIWPDKTQAEKDQMAQALALLQGQVQMNQGQLQINQVEAASRTVFVSGWRPFIGWVCGLACAWNWVGIPVVVVMFKIFHGSLEVKPADLSQMWPVLMGMLGMGALRTYEKQAGVAAK